ncbi:MAG TPA: PPOX class F420-dependent oxidoreductase [Acidimicrobiales bacterium]|nr:PPOX class F420-dependent oxidoreductase [Acidimicrobiales bacterium]
MTDASAVPASHVDILTKNGFAHIATVGPDGRPQSSPVWYDWDGSQLLFSQTTGRQKYKNLLRDGHVALSVTDPENPYRYIEIRGTVVFDDDPGGAFINKMAKKYLNEDVYPWPQPGDVRVVGRVTPEHTTTQG